MGTLAQRGYGSPAVLLAACLALAFPPIAASQVATPAPANPSPAPLNPPQITPPQVIGPPDYMLRERVPLTFLDIVVTDSKGNPIHGLQQSDFTILEDNQPMQPNSFEEHRTDLPASHPPAPYAPALIKRDLAPNTFTNFAATPSNGAPIVILLFDSLNIAARDQGMVQQHMLDFLDRAAPGTPMAVLSLSTHLTILQGVTTDTELLKAAIASKRMLPSPSALEDPWQDRINRDAGLGVEPLYHIVEKEGDAAEMRGQYELSAMNQIARYLAGMPGRKNLIWFTGLFPLQFPPFPDDDAFPAPPSPHPRPPTYNFEAELKSATDLLARARVAVYPIDGRGVENLPTPLGFEGDNRTYINRAEHDTMTAIAQQTGGKAFYNTNAIAEAVRQALDSGSNFYTVTYTPTDRAIDNRFHTIKVQVDQPKLRLIYRAGYYTGNPDTTLLGLKVPRATAMQAAMLHGAIEPAQILFDAKIDASDGTDEQAAGEIQTAIQYPPLRHYTVSYTAQAGNFAFERGKDGLYYGRIEFVVLVYKPDGTLLTTYTKYALPTFTKAEYEAMQKYGAAAHQQIDLPPKGDYFLRIGVHDLGSDRVGALELSTASIASTPDIIPAAPAVNRE
jgi:VWFA-related protein